MADELVLETQKWLNKTYGDVEGFGHVDPSGLTGWDTVYGLIRAAQHEMGITGLVDNWGPTSQNYWESQFANKFKVGYTHNVVKIVKGAFWAKGVTPGDFTNEVTEELLSAISTLKSDAGLSDTSDYPDKDFMGALLSMKQFTLVPGGDLNVQKIQKTLNHDYYDYLVNDDNVGILATDGIFQRDSSAGMIYALQDTLGLGDIATGFIGDGTRSSLAAALPLEIGDTSKLVMIANWGLYVNGFNQINTSFSETLTITQLSQFKQFAEFMGLKVSDELTFETYMSLITSNGDVNRAAHAVDTSAQLDSESAAVLKKNGYTIVGRYLTGTVGTGADERPKNLTGSELESLFKAGLSVFPIFQEGAPIEAAYFTADQGKTDANKAWHAANDLGFAPGTVIYFAVDGDILGGDIAGSVGVYFKAVTNVMNQAGYKVGIYGTRNVTEVIIESGFAEKAFVSNMSSGYSGNMGFKMPDAWAFDQFTETSIGGIPIDKVGTTSDRSTAVKSVDNISGNDYQLLSGVQRILSAFPLTENIEVGIGWKNNKLSGNAGPLYIELEAEAGLTFTGKATAKFEINGEEIDLGDVLDQIKDVSNQMGLGEAQQIVNQINKLGKAMKTGTVFIAIAPANAKAGGRYGISIVSETKYDKTEESNGEVITVSEDMTVTLSMYFRGDPNAFNVNETQFDQSQSVMQDILSGTLAVEKYVAGSMVSAMGYAMNVVSNVELSDGEIQGAELSAVLLVAIVAFVFLPVGL